MFLRSSRYYTRLRRMVGLWVACLGVLSHLATATQWVVETNSFSIKEPSSLQGEYDAAIGDFGVPLYGASLQGQLKFIPSNEKGCDPFHNDFESEETNFVALVMRGECYFLEKAYNAEKAGAKAILVMDDRDEQLLTMAAPEDRPEIAKLREDITIPTALIGKAVGNKLKDALNTSGVPIIIELDWKESVVHPDERVEWEFWTSSNDGCGNSCDIQLRFKKEFRDTAVKLEKAGNTLFTPHYMSRECTAGLESHDCKNNCIHYGRYCAMDSIGDQYKDNFHGWQVVEENKRQLCVFEQAKEAGKPWLWWDFVGGYGTRCTFENGKFNDADCAKAEVETVGLDNAKVLACMASSWEDVDHPLLKADFEAEGRDIWGGARILLLPTVTINTNQYRGRLDPPSVVRALCAGFSESTEPEICLSGVLETNECAADTHDCWRENGKSACQDTFRGYVCQCPAGYHGDGHTCEDIDECAEGTAMCDQVCVNEHGGFRCACKDGYRLLGTPALAICSPIDQCRHNNGGCEETCSSHDGQKTCSCRQGLRLAEDGTSCIDVDECAEGSSGCKDLCENSDPRVTGLQYVCKCREGSAVNPENAKECVQQTQYLQMLGLSTLASGGRLTWVTLLGVVSGSALIAIAAGFAIHRWRMRRVMQTEIHNIMRQYMPLEGNHYPEEDQQLQDVKSSIKAQLAEQC